MTESGEDDWDNDCMDVRKRLQLEEDAQEEEKMTENGGDEWGNDCMDVRKWLQLEEDD